MKKYLFLFPLVICMASCAQYKYGLAKTYGYYKESFPGAQMVDDYGRPVKNGPDTTYIIVIETKPNAKTKWTYAWANGHSFRLVPYQVKSPFPLGQLRNETTKVEIVCGNENELWQLITEKDEYAKPLPSEFKQPLGEQSILLQGIEGEKKVFQVIKTLVQLSPLHHM